MWDLQLTLVHSQHFFMKKMEKKLCEFGHMVKVEKKKNNYDIYSYVGCGPCGRYLYLFLFFFNSTVHTKEFLPQTKTKMPPFGKKTHQ